ncbi:MAG: hypothetical protein A2X36_13305 [Elusimicrobia bacterium GWA2_69_24]|nr:MAG: hypothetical protein A2X36_13305 [Elusimicrobia bacterium GWA2_69_24]HBL15761.1 hypothetical protein [Elusimicrobiota bacterium]
MNQREEPEHGLYGIVFGLALALALIIAYYGFRRMGKSPLDWRRGGEAVEVQGDSRDGIDRAPASVPPLSIINAPGKPLAAPRSRKTPAGAVPMGSITPDVESPSLK